MNRRRGYYINSHPAGIAHQAPDLLLDRFGVEYRAFAIGVRDRSYPTSDQTILARSFLIIGFALDPLKKLFADGRTLTAHLVVCMQTPPSPGQQSQEFSQRRCVKAPQVRVACRKGMFRLKWNLREQHSLSRASRLQHRIYFFYSVF